MNEEDTGKVTAAIELSADARELRGRARERRSGYLGLLAALAVILTLVLSVLINLKLQERSDLRDCGTLRAIIAVFAETPPPTATGQKLEQAYRAQYAQYGCKPDSLPVVRPSARIYPSDKGN